MFAISTSIVEDFGVFAAWWTVGLVVLPWYWAFAVLCLIRGRSPGWPAASKVAWLGLALHAACVPPVAMYAAAVAQVVFGLSAATIPVLFVLGRHQRRRADGTPP